MSILVNKSYTLGNLVSFDSDGLSIASFVDIKKALIDRQRQLYGYDIDVSDASADGQWITEIALLINNTLQALNNLYANLNPAVAQGYALDVLASFSNVIRHPASKSICEVKLSRQTATNYLLAFDTEFIDKNGLVWEIDASRQSYLDQFQKTQTAYVLKGSTLISDSGAIIPLICKDTGAINIPAETIQGFLTIDASNSDIVVSQSNPGIKGSLAESDAHLRARRNNSIAAEATTVIEGIKGALLANQNVIDAFIENDDINHCIKPVIRKRVAPLLNESATSLDETDEFVAQVILEKLTPGIPSTVNANTTTALKNQKKQYTSQVENTAFTNVVEWANAYPIHPLLNVTLHPLSNFDAESSAKNIIAAIANYANTRGLAVDLDANGLLQEVIYADPLFQGRATYYCTPADVKINDVEFTFKPSENVALKDVISAQERLTYYDYNDEFDDDYYQEYGVIKNKQADSATIGLTIYQAQQQ